jgi:hypothetical protein
VRAIGFPLEPVPRAPAASEAAHELQKKIYRDQRPSLLNRAIDWVIEQLRDLLGRASEHSPGGGLGLLFFVALFVVIVGVLIWRFGLPGRGARTRPVVDAVTPTRSAVEHERQADAYAAEGRWAEAVRERLRGLVAGLVARDLVDNRPGRTAREVAAEASRALPAATEDLSAAVGIFADVWYGGRTANEDHDQRMRAIAARVAATEPTEASTEASDTWVVPGSVAATGAPR